MSNESGPQMPPSGRLILTLALIAMLSGFTVVFAYQVTLEPIARNHREFMEAAIFEVVPGAETRVNYRVDDDGLHELAEDDVDNADFFAAYDASGELAGLALRGAGRGYADIVRVMYGYDPGDECTIGYTVLESRETPGLGDKVGSDERFLANFDCLDLSLNEEKTGLENPVVTVGAQADADAWEINAITGATVSSEAVATAIRESADHLLPRIAPYFDQLKEGRS